MPAKLTNGTVRDLETLFETGLVGDWSDGQLLEQFRSGPGPTAEVAFAALIRRHGPMVLRVCRSVLNDEHDAQDAFQATFLVLVRKAGSIRNRFSVASWLYGVAHRVASRAKLDVARRRAHERRAATLIKELQYDRPGGAVSEPAVLDEEIRRLPEKYRAVVVLCYLEGLSQDQAALSLGWPSGSVRGRLFRARELLRSRLSRRGVVLPAGLVTAGCSSRDEATVPAVLFSLTPRAALLAAAGKNAASGAVSEAVVALAAETLRAMSYAGFKSSLALIGLVLATTSVAGLAVHFGPPQRRPVTMNSARPVLTPKHDPPLDKTLTREAKQTVGNLGLAAKLNPPAGDQFPDRDPAVPGFPLEMIEVDGDLSDWPKDMIRYPIDKLLMLDGLGSGGLKGADLAKSRDLSPSFSIGYNLREQLLLLAVVVRDDMLVVGNTSNTDTDAVEVYIDGLRSERRIPTPNRSPIWPHADLSELPVQQYIALPGPGRVYGSPQRTNPVLMGGDLRKTRTKMAFRRIGDITTYEWAIEAFDRYPDQPTKLEPGKRIGFDLAVVDRDVSTRSSRATSTLGLDGIDWVYWGPQWAGVKVLNAGNLGEVILAAPR